MLGLSFDPLYKAVGFLLAFFYSLPPHNMGVAIILMTIVVMLVQLPFIAKQTRSMILMQRVQPEIKKIQQKYKDDKQKQNEELLKFYQENKINPLAGCLPLLFVLPIGMAVFRFFRQGATLVKDKSGKVIGVDHASRGIQGHLPRSGSLGRLYSAICGSTSTSVHDCALALKQHHGTPKVFSFLGMNLTWSASEVSKQIPGEYLRWLPYYGLIALVIFTGWYQVRQTQARQLKSGGAAPPQQMQAITKIMPVFFGLITFALNAATTLYFVVSNFWRIGQQHFVLNKMYEEEGLMGGGAKKPPPASTEKSSPSESPDKPSPPAARKAPPKGPVPKPPASDNGASRPSANAARKKKKRRR